MPKYKHPLAYYKQELSEAETKLRDAKMHLASYLGENTGRYTTYESNRTIISIVDNIEVLGYNQAHFTGIIHNIEKGYIAEGKD